ncbi:MAG: hypothetical protein FJZ66_02310 [Bacteroidetes bacterium]|nr:hypothetical protein [Bacteroidota bacterium]
MYPLLGFERGNVVPEEVYFSISDKYKPEDRKLVLVYDPRMDLKYESFKEDRLVNHKLLHERLEDQNGNDIFVFDMSSFAADWDLFFAGKYSQMSLKIRNEILNFFEKNSGNYIYVNSFLFPEKWFKRYAEILDVSEELLKEVGELCDIPNLEKEQLNLVFRQEYDTPLVRDISEVKVHFNQCDRCNGQGHIPKYNHISNGICFKCYGRNSVKNLVA